MEQTESRMAPTDYVSNARRNFLKGSAGAGVAALLAVSAQRSAYAKVLPQNLETDADILNFALTLEHIEAEFYKMAVDSGNLSGDVLTVLTAIRDHEVAHVEFLSGALKQAGYEGMATADVVNKDAFDVSSQDAILKLAITFEPVGVGAYTAAAPLLKNKDFLAAAGSIEQLEARHEGAVRVLLGQPASVNVNEFALGPTMPPAEVLKAVTPFLNS